ncbi:MAG: VWA domain-containing protein [Xanthomonadales bacterium]|nr:VWA domain-containing protein [Xanthomonadales bacterium]
MMDALPLHFIRPLWLALIPLAVIIPLVWRHLRRPSGDWSKVCDSHLLRWLSVGNAAAKPSRIGPWLAGLVWLIAAFALAGPSWQKLPDSSFASKDARVLVLDLSLSMLAEDLKPNRLTQARFRLSDMLNETLEGQTGMVAFAGDAFVVSPLTSDTNTIGNMLPALRPDVIPVAGSRPDRALQMAAELLTRSGMTGGEILLIADSGSSAASNVANKLAKQGVYTSVLAVGTVQGAPIPSGDGFVSDSNGNIVVARLERDALQSIANAGGGKYSELTAGSTAISPWAAVKGSEFARKDDALGERWKDSGPWFLLALLPLVAFSFRRGLLFVLPLLVLPGMLMSTDAKAGIWEDLWASKDQQAQKALSEDRAADAAALANDPAIAAEALYRNDEFAGAAQSWSQLDEADSHYNRGNSMAQAGEFEAALAAYDAALEHDSEMEDAIFNRALVEQMQQEKEQQEQEQEDSEGESSEEQSDQDSEDGEQSGEQSDSEQEGEQSEQDSDEQKEGEEEPSESEMEQNWSEEDAQAMEQWLRRIPDDPGGLLRRKFRNQHQRRGAPADESETW